MAQETPMGTMAWTRRAWILRTTTTTAGLWTAAALPGPRLSLSPPDGRRPRWLGSVLAADQRAVRLDPGPIEALAKEAVAAAQAAGAQYTDARLTRTVQERYYFSDSGQSSTVQDLPGFITGASEVLGVGVRVLVNGYWGFAASPVWAQDEVARLAQEAVAQARANALGTPRAVELGPLPAVTGRWTTPIRIDPFTISIEEKEDTMGTWHIYAKQAGVGGINPLLSWLHFVRQERVLATSAGTCVTQTLYESGGKVVPAAVASSLGDAFNIRNIAMAGAGWERLLDANIPGQLDRKRAELDEASAAGGQPASVGRYTLVCDGATMASIVEQTFGLATQLDRALGYEANASGTSYLDDPLTMVGSLQVAAPAVTVTANRSAPRGLATVAWDDEGVVPEPCTLVKDGVLVDFQTTREQAAWLAPYYQKAGKPVRSHGHAAAEDALYVTLQHMPNLTLAPNPSSVSLDDLVANVNQGILVLGGIATTDYQARNGLVAGSLMRKITNGRLGKWLLGGYIQFSTTDFWRHLVAIGGAATQGELATSHYSELFGLWHDSHGSKGEPPQHTNHTTQAVAAVIPNQALINVRSQP